MAFDFADTLLHESVGLEIIDAGTTRAVDKTRCVTGSIRKVLLLRYPVVGTLSMVHDILQQGQVF